MILFIFQFGNELPQHAVDASSINSFKTRWRNTEKTWAFKALLPSTSTCNSNVHQQNTEPFSRNW